MRATTRRTIRLSSDWKFFVDGNSMVTEASGATNWPTFLRAMAPYLGSGATMQNFGVASRTWATMHANAGALDTALAGAGEKKLLGLFEHTNSICNAGQSVADAYADMVRYIRARRAVWPTLRVFVMEAIPRESVTLTTNYQTVLACNAGMQMLNQMVWENRRALDIEFVPTRHPGSPFAFSNFTTADFNASGSIWNESAGSRVHVNDAGKQVLANFAAAAVRRMTEN